MLGRRSNPASRESPPWSPPGRTSMPLQLEPLDPLIGLDALEMPAVVGDGQPKLLPIHAIDEDPDQPRSEFVAEALQQLADTITRRGVRQPISVRPHPAQPGRWILNF